MVRVHLQGGSLDSTSHFVSCYLDTTVTCSDITAADLTWKVTVNTSSAAKCGEHGERTDGVHHAGIGGVGVCEGAMLG